MSLQFIDIGTSSNDGTGDTLRNAGGKINNNFFYHHAIFTPLSAVDLTYQPISAHAYDLGTPTKHLRHLYVDSISLSASISGRPDFNFISTWYPLAKATPLDPSHPLLFTVLSPTLSSIASAETRWDTAYMSVIANSAAWFQGQGGGGGVSIAQGANKVGVVSGSQICWAGNNASHSFPLTGALTGRNAEDLLVDIGGVVQSPGNDYKIDISGNNITFFQAPPAVEICARIFLGDSFVGVPTNNVSDVYTGSGVLTGFSLSRLVHFDRDLLVSLDGLIQLPTLHYTLSTAGLSGVNAPFDTLVFSSAPFAGVNIEARHLSTVTVSSYTDTSVLSSLSANWESTYLQVQDSTTDLIVDGGTLSVDKSTGYVGIGITNPSAKLHVVGSAIISGGNLGFGTTDQFGGGDQVIGIANAATVPVSNPTGGGVLYVENGALKYRGSSGTLTMIASA